VNALTAAVFGREQKPRGIRRPCEALDPAVELVGQVGPARDRGRRRAGATLLYDSIPALEEQETRIKATSFFRSLRGAVPVCARPSAVRIERDAGVKLLLVDNDDCFIHTLSNYARQTGAEVVTYRAGIPPDMILKLDPDNATAVEWEEKKEKK